MEADSRDTLIGTLFHRDFRDPSAPKARAGSPFRLATWNIERGYKLDGCIKELWRLNADVLALQEVDVACDRSRGRDTGLEIARALKLNYVFLPEFEELRSPLRSPSAQGGGLHGNALATRFDVLEARVLRHRQPALDWSAPSHALARREPRRGERAVLRAVVATPAGPLVVYCVHLEVFCGIPGRWMEFADVLRDCRSALDAGYGKIAILGDLNTMAHGIARLSPHYCQGGARFWTLGRAEAQVWERDIFAWADPRYAEGQGGGRSSERGDFTEPDACSLHPRPQPQALPLLPLPPPVNPRLLRWGLDAGTAADLLNPGLSDPFPPTTVTLDNAAYRPCGVPLMAGKLDWVLLRGLRVLAKDSGNADFALSDHAWLSAVVA